MRKARTRPRKKNPQCRSIWIKVESYTDDCTTASTISNQDNVEKLSTRAKAEEEIEEILDEKFSENIGENLSQKFKEKAEGKESFKKQVRQVPRAIEEQFDFKRILMSLKDLTNEINQGVEEVRKQCSNVLERI